MRFGLFSNGQGIREYEHTVDAWDADVREIVLAERLGFQEAWISEHRAAFLPDALPSPELMVTKAAALTETILLGTAVRRLGLYEPTQVAREAACTDVLTRGRYVLGAGSGPVPAGSDQHGMALEALDLIERALAAREPFDYHGRFFREEGVAVWPKPAQSPLPIAVATTTDAVLVEAAARGWRVLTSQWAAPRTVRRIAAVYNEAAARSGKPDQLHNVTATRGLYIADTDERAYAEVVPALRRHLDFTRKYFDFSLAEFLRPGQTYADLTVEQLIDDGLLFVGSPGTVAERIARFHRETGGFGQFLIVGGKDWGSEDQRVRSFELFATKVVPQLREFDVARTVDAGRSRLAEQV